MKLNKFAYLYTKPLGNHTLKIMKKIPGNLLKNLENHGNIMEFCQSEKVGTLYSINNFHWTFALKSFHREDINLFVVMNCPDQLTWPMLPVMWPRVTPFLSGSPRSIICSHLEWWNPIVSLSPNQCRAIILVRDRAEWRWMWEQLTENLDPKVTTVNPSCYPSPAVQRHHYCNAIWSAKPLCLATVKFQKRIFQLKWTCFEKLPF